MSTPSTFRNSTSIAARAAEVPDADFTNGMNNGGCGPGIGIAQGVPGLNTDQWTLLDQFGDARNPQVNQLIGGLGYSDPGTSSGAAGNGQDDPGNEFQILIANPTQAAKDADPSVDGTVIVNDTAKLVDLALGWQPSSAP